MLKYYSSSAAKGCSAAANGCSAAATGCSVVNGRHGGVCLCVPGDIAPGRDTMATGVCFECFVCFECMDSSALRARATYDVHSWNGDGPYVGGSVSRRLSFVDPAALWAGASLIRSSMWLSVLALSMLIVAGCAVSMDCTDLRTSTSK